jgi:hypothetical protein
MLSRSNNIGSVEADELDAQVLKVGGKDVMKGVSATAEVNNSTGTPSVNVTKSGTDSNPSFNFAFKNIKGATGATGSNGANGTSAYWFTGTAVTGTGTNISASVSGSKAGDMYLNTGSGSNYCNVYTATAANKWNYVCNIKGATGAAGSNGTNGTSAYWFTGTAVTGTGTNISATVSGSKAGDMYINTGSGNNYCNVYTATAANKWNYVCNIKGADSTSPDHVVQFKPYGEAKADCVVLFNADDPDGDVWAEVGSAAGSTTLFGYLLNSTQKQMLNNVVMSLQFVDSFPASYTTGVLYLL